MPRGPCKEARWVCQMQPIPHHNMWLVQQSGATSKTFRVKKASKLVHLTKIWGTRPQKVVIGEVVREVAAREAQQKKHAAR